MYPEDLQKRTKSFAVRIVKLVQYFHNDAASKVIGNQLLRSATSVAANYRAACKAKSIRDFISKLGIVIEEADESQFWLELLIDCEMIKSASIADLLKEAREITAIMVASKRTSITKLHK